MILLTKEIEFEFPGMEPLASESVFFSCFFVREILSIDLITEDRISDRREVDSYLMCPTGEEVDLKESIFVMVESFLAKLRLSKFWIDWIHGCHLFSVMWISSDEGFDIPLFIMHFPDDECEIGLMDRTFCDLQLE